MIHARDLFGPAPAQAATTRPRKPPPAKLRLTRPEPAEAQVLRAVRSALHWHPAVAHVFRVNSGSAWLPGRNGRDRPVKFHDIEGCSDLVGILKDGRWLAVECKRPSTRARASVAQLGFLAKVRCAGGIAFVAADAEECIGELDRQLVRNAA